jgi:hypothetical protein
VRFIKCALPPPRRRGRYPRLARPSSARLHSWLEAAAARTRRYPLQSKRSPPRHRDVTWTAHPVRTVNCRGEAPFSVAGVGVRGTSRHRDRDRLTARRIARVALVRHQLQGQTLIRAASLERVNEVLRTKEPKTAQSRRTVALPGFALDVLRRQRAAQNERRILRAMGPQRRRLGVRPW